MKYLILLTAVVTLFSCGEASAPKPAEAGVDSVQLAAKKKAIESMLDSFNVAATNADFNRYFSYFTADGVFIGTDATEYWNKEQFMVWAKPFFDRGKAWNFVSLKRNIYFDATGNTAWFDELLDTQMKICRGSGVVSLENGTWKVRQYVLSMTVPNSQVDPVVALKAPEEDSLLKLLKTNGR